MKTPEATIKHKTPERPSPEREITLESARADILRTFPELAGASVEPAGSGMGSRAFLVDGQWIFRFAKNEDASEGYKKEKACIANIQKHIDLAVPVIEYSGTQAASGLNFAGHKKIAGEELRNPTKKQIEELRHFVEQLHAIDAVEAEKWGLEIFELREYYTRMLDGARNLLYPEIKTDYPEDSAKIEKYIETLFASYLNKDENFSYKPVVVHGDIDPEHIMVNPETGRLAGIFDWGNLCITDPDYDLWRLKDRYGDAYPIDHSPEKIDFFSHAQVVWRALHNLKKGDPAKLKKAMENLRNIALNG